MVWEKTCEKNRIYVSGISDGGIYTSIEEGMSSNLLNKMKEFDFSVQSEVLVEFYEKNDLKIFFNNEYYGSGYIKNLELISWKFKDFYPFVRSLRGAVSLSDNKKANIEILSTEGTGHYPMAKRNFLSLDFQIIRSIPEVSRGIFSNEIYDLMFDVKIEGSDMGSFSPYLASDISKWKRFLPARDKDVVDKAIMLFANLPGILAGKKRNN